MSKSLPMHRQEGKALHINERANLGPTAQSTAQTLTLLAPSNTCSNATDDVHADLPYNLDCAASIT